MASKQILADAPQLQSQIDGRLRYGLAFVEDTRLLLGQRHAPMTADTAERWSLRAIQWAGRDPVAPADGCEARRDPDAAVGVGRC